MEQMDGSRNETHLLAKVDKDPDKMAMESMAEYYERLFKRAGTTQIAAKSSLRTFPKHNKRERELRK